CLAHRGAQAVTIGPAPGSRDQHPANRRRVEFHQLRHGIVNEGLGLIGRSRNGEAVPVRNARAAPPPCDGDALLALADTGDEDRLVKNLIDNVAAILEPVIDDGGISRLGDAAPGPDDQQRWRFRLLHRVRHFDDGFDAIIVNPDGLPACAAVNAIVEIEIGEIFAPSPARPARAIGHRHRVFGARR
ncbi:hypothetical protein KXX12_008361, partial [Aspergillus fumigatus]